MSNQINNLWLKLVESPFDLSLETRIFHSISVGLILLSAIYIPYNFFAGLYMASLSCFIFCIFFSSQYYYSRFHGRKHNTVVFGVAGIVVFSINYFFNSGIDGSTDLIWPAYLLVLLSISPYRQHLMWVSVYLIAFSILHLAAYTYPALVQYPFNAGKGKLIDRITALPMPVLTIYILINFMRKSYDKERITAEEKTRAVESKNEQIIQQKEQLEQSNAEKNRLMSIISHDMRAPLINIQSYLELLTEMDVDSTQRSVLEKDLLIATNSTMQMLSNLLYWSKSQMDGQALNLAEVNLLSGLQHTLDMEKMLAAKKGICLTHDVAPQITVMADTDMLQLVVRNLINNAIKFTPPGGSIHIDAQIIHNDCKITVTDNGNGIDQSKQERIFSIAAEPAYGTNNEKGIGLGLLLCKEFIERQNGRIGFESTPGKGSSFFIFIPLNTAPVPSVGAGVPVVQAGIG